MKQIMALGINPSLELGVSGYTWEMDTLDVRLDMTVTGNLRKPLLRSIPFNLVDGDGVVFSCTGDSFH